MIKGVLLDLDGTVYWGQKQVPGAADFLAFLRTQSIRCLFVTNRANRTPQAICEHLRGYGIACTPDDVLTSAQATAAYLTPGPAYYIGEDGMYCALMEAGFEITDNEPDYVIVSYDRGFSYDKLATACRLIGAGAKFVATNDDKAINTEDGLAPGSGALVAAVAAGSGREPLLIGKPERPLFDMALRRLNLPADDVIAVGDNPATDLPAGQRAGIRTAYMLTGVGTRDDLKRLALRPTWVAADFGALTRIVGSAAEQPYSSRTAGPAVRDGFASAAKNKAKNLSSKYQPWVEARKRFHLSHAHIQMARELGMNPKKFGRLANHKQEPWKAPLPVFIEELYRKRFKKDRPGDTRPLATILEERERRKAARKAARREQAGGQAPRPDESDDLDKLPF
jgi:4-nitrophenyl phosphatase